MTMREDENNNSAESVSADSILLNADILSDEFDDEPEESENETAENKQVNPANPAALQTPADPLAISISIDEERPKYKTEKKKKEFVDFVEKPPIRKKTITDTPEKDTAFSRKKRNPLFGADLNRPLNSEKMKDFEKSDRTERDAFKMKAEPEKADEKKSAQRRSPLQNKESLHSGKKQSLSIEKRISATAEKRNSEKAEKWDSKKKDQTGMQIGMSKTRETKMQLQMQPRMQKRMQNASELSGSKQELTNKSFSGTETALSKRGNRERIKTEPPVGSRFGSAPVIQNLNSERKKKAEDVFFMSAPKKMNSEKSRMDFIQPERKKKSDGGMETERMRIKNER